MALQLPWLLQLDFTEAAALPVTSSARPIQPPKTDAGAPAEGSDAASLEAPPADPGGDLSSREDFFDALPEALGRDLVALSAQLHYLDVHTVRGRSLVLYNLRDAVEALKGSVEGLQIHRSHWVADRHVRRLMRQGKRLRCELSNGLELPVSRRRQGEAKRRWGSGRFVD